MIYQKTVHSTAPLIQSNQQYELPNIPTQKIHTLYIICVCVYCPNMCIKITKLLLSTNFRKFANKNYRVFVAFSVVKSALMSLKFIISKFTHVILIVWWKPQDSCLLSPLDKAVHNMLARVNLLYCCQQCGNADSGDFAHL